MMVKGKTLDKLVRSNIISLKVLTDFEIPVSFLNTCFPGFDSIERGNEHDTERS